MSCQPVNPQWFQRLRTVGLLETYAWLAQLRDSVNSIVDFGCWSSEPFALLWTLDASEIVIIEKKAEHLEQELGPLEELEVLRNVIPESLNGRKVQFIVADMALQIEGLSSDKYDLSFCKDVLYFMEDDLQIVRNAITEMSRIVKPSGLLIAAEPKLGAKFKSVSQHLFGNKIEVPVPVSDPIDNSYLFESVGLIRNDIEGAPEWTYCYQ